jgi:hypothetical protein
MTETPAGNGEPRDDDAAGEALVGDIDSEIEPDVEDLEGLAPAWDWSAEEPEVEES